MPVCRESELTIDKIIYNPPVATIVFWNDGTKTVSKCEVGDVYSPELGFMICVLKKKYGNKRFHDMMNKYVYDVVNSENADEWGRVVWDRMDTRSCKKSQESKAPVYIKIHKDGWRPIDIERLPEVKLSLDMSEEEPFKDIAFKVGDDKHDTDKETLDDTLADLLDMVADLFFGEGSGK